MPQGILVYQPLAKSDIGQNCYILPLYYRLSSISAATTKYLRLSNLWRTEIYFSQFWRAESSRDRHLQLFGEGWISTSKITSWIPVSFEGEKCCVLNGRKQKSMKDKLSLLRPFILALIYSRGLHLNPSQKALLFQNCPLGINFPTHKSEFWLIQPIAVILQVNGLNSGPFFLVFKFNLIYSTIVH